MNKKALLVLAKLYSTYSPTLFKDKDTFEGVAGYKFIKHTDGTHLCFTNRATMPDFLIEDGREDTVLTWLKDAGIPEAKFPDEPYHRLITIADKEPEVLKAVDFITVVNSGSKGIKMPNGVFLNVNQIKPSIPFLDEIVYYSMVASKHMIIYEYGSDFRLHVSPLIYRPEDWSINEIHDKAPKKENKGAGLFF